jgi:hypothetical protein
MAAGGPGTRRWRSRAFVQPLLVTLVGVAALPAIYMAWSYLDDIAPCTETWCGYGSGVAIISGVVYLAVWCAVMVITGFVVGRSSRDSSLALRAVLVAVGSLALTASIVSTASSTTPESFLDTIYLTLGLAIVPLISVLVGFRVGHLVRPSPKDQSDASGPRVSR